MTEEVNKPVVFIGLPVYGGQLLAENAAAIEQTIVAFEKAGWGYFTYRVGMSDIEDARNCMLTYWYDRHPESDYILMIDNDMLFKWQMVINMFALNKPVVGCVYSKKHIVEPDKNGETNFWDIAVGEPLPEKEKAPIVNGFQRWKYVGGGVLLIRRDAVTEILRRFPEINDTTDPGFVAKSGVSRVIGAFNKLVTDEGRHLSEDCSFCHRWGECGGEVWAAVDFWVGHRGMFTYEFHAKSMLGLTGEEAPTLQLVKEEEAA